MAQATPHGRSGGGRGLQREAMFSKPSESLFGRQRLLSILGSTTLPAALRALLTEKCPASFVTTSMAPISSASANWAWRLVNGGGGVVCDWPEVIFDKSSLTGSKAWDPT